MKKALILTSIVILLAGISFFWAFTGIEYLRHTSSTENQQTPLDQEDIANLAKPSVARIIQHSAGTVWIPNFKIDFKNSKVVPLRGRKTKIDFDEIFTGSGFIIHKNGYILTNSHIVSYHSIKSFLSEKQSQSIIEKQITEQILKGDSNISSYLAGEDQDKNDALFQSVFDYVLVNSDFKIAKKIAVLNPLSKKETIKELLAEGFPAEIISVNDNYDKDEKDIALIKIEKTDLPTIKLGNSDNLSIGNQVSVFGFPASAEFNKKNLLEPTLTAGVVNAFKDSANKDFKIFQSDAKISYGSSGGPVVNAKGEAVGIITYQSSEIQRSAGDNFSFAIPVNMVNSFVRDYATDQSRVLEVLNEGSYADNFITGVQLSKTDRCAKALSILKALQTSDENFPTWQYVDSYIEKCLKTIASGKSIDTLFDEKKWEIRNMNTLAWIFIGGIFLAFILSGILVFFIIYRVEQDEARIKELQRELNEDHKLAQQAYSSCSACEANDRKQQQ